MDSRLIYAIDPVPNKIPAKHLIIGSSWEMNNLNKQPNTFFIQSNIHPSAYPH